MARATYFVRNVSYCDRDGGMQRPRHFLRSLVSRLSGLADMTIFTFRRRSVLADHGVWQKIENQPHPLVPRIKRVCVCVQWW